MPILQRETRQSAVRRILLTTGLGILFGVPPIVALQALGLTWPLYAVAAIALIVGFVLAYSIVGFVVTAPVTPAPVEVPPSQGTMSFKQPPPGRTPTVIDQRLAAEKADLDRLDDERQHLGNPAFGGTEEQRIIWSELLDLELQDIDEQINRIRHEESLPGRFS
jgi:hypothetical protein